MGGTVQQPRTQYPQAEYFALVPGRNIALGPRLNRNVLGNSVVVPAGSGLTVNQNIEILDNWGYGDGVYISRVYVLYVTGDQSGEVQIQQARMGIGNNTPAGIYLDLGVPLLTFASPPNAQVAIYDRDALITFLDTTSVAPPNQPLFLVAQLTLHNNDSTNGHFIALQSVIVYHSLKGFVQ